MTPLMHGTPETAILGMGRTGCSIARFLDAQGEVYVAFDEKLKTLPEGIRGPLKHGRFHLRTLRSFKRIFVSPGIAWRQPLLEALREHGVTLLSDVDLFREHFHGELAAVTGTNGKSTVVHVIGQLLEVLPGGVEIGGNIGIPMLDMLADGQAAPRAVLELSSFQLERCGGIHPRWAALLNVQPDHADMHADMHAYEAAKLRLFAEQGEGDTAVLPVISHWNGLAGSLRQKGVRVRRFGKVERMEDADAGLLGDEQNRRLFWTADDGVHEVMLNRVRVRGEHQHLNLAVAAQAASDFGVSAAVIAELLTVFRGLDHRLRYVGNLAGKTWYDDSKATNPEAAVAALNSFDKVIWICGGLTKGLDVMPMLPTVRAHVARALVLGKDAAPFAALLDAAGVVWHRAADMDDAVMQAAASDLALPVLLSPAAASMDQFADYAERGRCFTQAVAALEKAA